MCFLRSLTVTLTSMAVTSCVQTVTQGAQPVSQGAQPISAHGVTAAAPNERIDGVRWGAVGHDDRPSFGANYAYNRVSFDKQMQLINAAGLHWFRTGCADKSCPALVEAAKKANVSLLSGFSLKPDEHANESENYQRAFKVAFDKAHMYRNVFEYYEASNEVDNWVGMAGDGSARGQYKQDRYQQARGLIKGLIDGAHAGDPSAKILVDDAGWCHYGFLKMLWDDGVRWDITAFHWYSSQGNMEKAGCSDGANAVAIHASFGRPVWITEFNSNTAAKNNDDAAAATWIADFVAQVRRVSSKYDIEGAFVYELLDEPNLKGMEGSFGIADGTGNPKRSHGALSESLGYR